MGLVGNPRLFSFHEFCKYLLVALGSSIISSGCRRVGSKVCFQALAELHSHPHPRPACPGNGFCLYSITQPFTKAAGDTFGSSNQQYYYCKDNYYLLSTHVCQAFSYVILILLITPKNCQPAGVDSGFLPFWSISTSTFPHQSICLEGVALTHP